VLARTCVFLVTARLADELHDHVWAAHHWQVTLAPELVMGHAMQGVFLAFPGTNFSSRPI
jgi:hypothetical protein